MDVHMHICAVCIVREKQGLNKTHYIHIHTQAIKAWRVYQLTEEALTTMGTVLPLVDDLHSPTMRGR